MTDLLPCPFCGKSLAQPYLKNPEVYRHPESTSCFAGKAIVYPAMYAAWNTRTVQAQIDAAVNAEREWWVTSLSPIRNQVEFYTRRTGLFHKGDQP